MDYFIACQGVPVNAEIVPDNPLAGEFATRNTCLSSYVTPLTRAVSCFLPLVSLTNQTENRIELTLFPGTNRSRLRRYWSRPND